MVNIQKCSVIKRKFPLICIPVIDRKKVLFYFVLIINLDNEIIMEKTLNVFNKSKIDNIECKTNIIPM